jgi:hypothetical protein
LRFLSKIGSDGEPVERRCEAATRHAEDRRSHAKHGAPARRGFGTDHLHCGGLHVIAYPAMLDVPVELVAFLADLLAAERRDGTRTGPRKLTCWNQAVLALV